jgi:signal transduction histidine kinase
MKLRLTIARQGLILVAVPLIVQLLFLILFALMATHFMDETIQLGHSTELLAQESYLGKTFLDAGVALSAAETTGDSQFLSQYNLLVSKLPQAFERLRQLCGNDESRLSRLQSLKQAGNKILSLTQSAAKQPADPHSFSEQNPDEYRHQLANAYAAFTDQMSHLSRLEEDRISENPVNEEKIRSRVLLPLAGGITMNLLSAFFLAIFFSRQLTRRLQILSENSKHFVRREPLSAPVSGNDEIAELDRDFRSMTETLTQAERRKQEYLQTINHDLRAPLAAIQGTLAVAARGTYGDLNEKGLKRIVDAERDADRLIRLITEMLDIDRIESGNFALDRSRFDIAPLLEEAIDSVAPLAADKSIKFNRQIENLSMNADRERILRVVINLLHNAIKFSPTGSSILVSAAQDNRQVKVMIRDSGPGIPRDEMQRIFQPFQQLNPADATTLGGTGLGLAICKGIVEAHGGLIGVRSDANKGSVFWFSVDDRTPATDAG